MRVIGEIPHNQYKITLYNWNNRFIIKIEDGYLEQTFKIDQFELPGEAVLYKMVDEDFLRQAASRFEDMHRSLGSALERS